MYKKEKVIQAIVQQGVLPLYFHPDETISIRVMESLYASGIRVIEYTNRGRQALKNFKSLKKTAGKVFPDLLMGLGTVMDAKTAQKAFDWGADFLVSPGYISELARFSRMKKILWIPGCMTPSELLQAQQSGQGLVKLFPANSLGPGFVRAVREVFPDLLFMPTGGVDSANMDSWFQAGVSAVGMGSSLISSTLMEHKQFENLKINTGALLKQIAAIRSSLV